MTALVANLPGLNVRSPTELRQSLPTVRSRHNDHSRRIIDPRGPRELDFSSDGISNGHHKSRKDRQKLQGLQLARSTASLDCKQSPMQMQRRKSPRIESAMEHLQKSRRGSTQLHSLEFDSEPTYYRLQVVCTYILCWPINFIVKLYCYSPAMKGLIISFQPVKRISLF